MPAFPRALAAILAFALAFVIPLAGQGRGAFGLGVLRRDGVLVPFAAFNGRAWTADWPGPNTNPIFPIGLGDIPNRWWGAPGPAASWTAWLIDGGTRALTLKKPEHLRVFCAAQLGIQTDYEGAAFDPRDPTLPKDGVAIAGDARLLPVTQVSLLSQDAKRLVEAITDDFNKEEKLAATHFMAWAHPFDAAERTQFPIELEA